MEKLDKEPVLHSLSCSPKRVWPASSWEIQGWRGFWRRAKSPVKKRKRQSAWLNVLSLFYFFFTCFIQSQDLLQRKKKIHYCIKHVQEGRMGLQVLSKPTWQLPAVLTFSYHVSKCILQEINTFPWWFLGVILNNTAFNHIVYKWKRNGYMKDILRETSNFYILCLPVSSRSWYKTHGWNVESRLHIWSLCILVQVHHWTNFC